MTDAPALFDLASTDTAPAGKTVARPRPASRDDDRFVLVTFIVSGDGEPLRPMTEEIARVDLGDDGEPVSLDDLNARVTRWIRNRRDRAQ